MNLNSIIGLYENEEYDFYLKTLEVLSGAGLLINNNDKTIFNMFYFQEPIITRNLSFHSYDFSNIFKLKVFRGDVFELNTNNSTIKVTINNSYDLTSLRKHKGRVTLKLINKSNDRINYENINENIPSLQSYLGNFTDAKSLTDLNSQSLLFLKLYYLRFKGKTKISNIDESKRDDLEFRNEFALANKHSKKINRIFGYKAKIIDKHIKENKPFGDLNNPFFTIYTGI